MSPARPTRDFNLTSTHQAGGLLDELTGSAAAPTRPAPPAPAENPAPPPRKPSPEAPAAPETTGRVPIRVQVPEELADRVRAAVAALAYSVDDWESLNTAAAAALAEFVTRAEREHNNGEPFPWTPGRQLRPGRRVGR